MKFFRITLDTCGRYSTWECTHAHGKTKWVRLFRSETQATAERLRATLERTEVRRWATASNAARAIEFERGVTLHAPPYRQNLNIETTPGVTP